MSSEQSMDSRIKQVIAVVLACPLDAITDDASPDVLANWDSLRHMNIILALEQEFGVQFGEQRLLELTSFALLRDEIRKLSANS